MLSRIRSYIGAHGVRKTLAAVTRRVRKLFSVDERFIILLKQLDSIVESRPSDLRVEDLEGKHLPALSELNHRRGRPQVDKRFAANVASDFKGFVAWKDDDLVGYYWWVDTEAPVLHPDLSDELNLGIEMKNGDVYGTDFFLLEDFRGAGRAPDFLYKIEKSLRDRGYRRLWGYVDAGNRAALWSYRARGYESMWILERKRRLWFRREAVLSV